MADYEVDDTGQLVVTGDVPEALKAVASFKRRAVSRTDGTEIVTTEIRLWDKVRALELLGKHLGLWAPEQTPVVPIQVNVMGAP